MRNWLSKSVAGILAGTFLAQFASAHPGHQPTDVVAQVSQPLAGPDHFVAFAVLTSVLLVAFRFVLKAREARNTKLQDPGSR
jgi:hydrogenase/urease accessory protein HupE